MSHAGFYLKKGKEIFSALDEGKPHSAITDWIEVLSSDRYDEFSLDGIPELVESINIQGHQGTTEAARAIRKKLKYGNVHRQIRALVILRALTDNAGKGFQLNWANPELLGRLKDMAGDSLVDPKVKKRLTHVFHAWSIQYKDEPRMQAVAKLYSQYAGGPGLRRASVNAGPRSDFPPASQKKAEAAKPAGGFSDYDDIFSHNWSPAPGQRGADTYADLASAKADAEERKRQREARIALEQREAEMERREREIKRKQDMAALEARRQKEALQEQERRRKMKEEARSAKSQPNQPKRPKFDFQKEKPQIMVAVATALQAANNLVNSCRHLNREIENVTESPKVQENLDKAKLARRAIVRYIQLVTDEEYVGTLLDANEKVVEAIQLYDKLSKPAVLDSDSDSEDEARGEAPSNRDVDNMSKRLAAQKLEADRTGELQRLQERQKKESQRQAQRRAQRSQSSRGGAHPDLQDLDFGSIGKQSDRLPPPMQPDTDRFSDSSYSDYEYNSSDEEWRARHQSRSRRQSRSAPSSSTQRDYASLDDEGVGKNRLLDSNDPFGDPFADDNDTPLQEKQRMAWTEI